LTCPAISLRPGVREETLKQQLAPAIPKSSSRWLSFFSAATMTHRLDPWSRIFCGSRYLIRILAFNMLDKG